MKKTAANPTTEATDRVRLSRALTIGNLYAKKYTIMELDGMWRELLGEIEQTGCWLIFGKEKNGKTRVAMLLAKYLCSRYRVLYVSAEEGGSKNFTNNCKWAGVTPSDRKLMVLDYIKIDELKQRLAKRNAPEIVFIDNITTYQDELKYGGTMGLLKEFRKTIFVFIAHEEDDKPYTATAKMASRLATVIMRVKGLQCHISGRVPGGVINIDEKKAKLFHGELGIRN